MALRKDARSQEQLDPDPVIKPMPPDPAWEPLLPTPAHPEYPSGYACSAGATERVLQDSLGMMSAECDRFELR